MHKFRRNKMKARILSVILTIGMILTMLPIAWANSAKASGSDLNYYTVATSSTSSTRAVRGVLNSYTDLPQYKYEQEKGPGSWKQLSVGTLNRPFLILEIVPQHEFAEFGYLIDGCEPIRMEDLHTSWVVSDVNAFLGSYFKFQQSSAGEPGAENSAHFFLDEKESQGKYYSDRAQGEAGADVATPTLPEETAVVKFEGYYERVADGKGNFVFDAAAGMKKQANGNIIWHTINPWEKQYVNYTFAEASTMKEEYFDEVGDRYYTYRQGGPADPYVDAGGYYYFYKNLDPFVTDVVGLSAAMAPTYSVLVKTITPDELSSVQKNNGFNWAEYADLIYINPKSHNKNYIDKWSLSWKEGANKVYANRLGEAPHSSENGFGTQDINFTIFKTIFDRACATENYVGLAFDYTMKDFLNVTSVNPKILDFNFHETYYNGAVRTSPSERGVSDNLGKLWVMCFAQNMNITKKMFWDTGKIYTDDEGKCAYMSCQAGGIEAHTWSEGNFLLIDPDTSTSEDTYSLLTSPDLWTSWNATTNINDNDYAFGHVYGYNGNNSLTQSFTTGMANISDSRFDEFSDYVKTDEGVRRAWESHNPGKDFDAELGGKYAGGIAPSAALRYILGLGSAPSTSFDGTLRVLNVEPSVGVTSTYGQNWKTSDKEVRLQMMLPDFMGDFEITSMTMGSFVGRTEDLSAYDLVYFGNETDGFWKDDKGKTDFVDPTLDGRIYSHVGDLMVGGKLGRVVNFVGLSDDAYPVGFGAAIQRQLDGSQYSVTYSGSGFYDGATQGSGTITVTNTGSKGIDDWSISFDYDGTISGLWGSGKVTKTSDNHYVIEDAFAYLGAGQSASITFGWSESSASKKPSNYSISYMEVNSSLDANQMADWLRFPGNDITQLKIRELNAYMEGGHPVVAHTNLFDATLMDQASYIYNFVNAHHPASSEEATGDKRVFKLAESSEIEKAVRASKIEVTFDDAYPIRYNDQKSDDEKYLKKVGERAYLQFKASVDEAGAYGYRIYVDQNRNAKFENDEKEWEGDITGNYLDTGTQCSLTKEMVGFVQWRIEIYKKSNDKLMRSEEGCSAIQFSGAEETKNKIHVLQIIPDNESVLNAKLTDDAYYNLYNELDAFDITVDVIKYSNFSNCFKDTGFSFNMGADISEANPSQTALDAVNTNFLSAEYVANDRDVEETRHRLDYYNMIIVGFADAYGQQDLSNDYGAAEYLYYFAMNNQGSILFTHDNTSLYNTAGSTGYTANTMMRDLMGMNRYGVNSTNADKLRTGLADSLEGYRTKLKTTIGGFTYDEPITYKDGSVVNVSQTQGFTINAMHKLGDPDNAEQKAYGFRFPYKYMAVDAKDGSSLFKDYAKETGDGTGFMRAPGGGQEPVCGTNRIVRLNQGQITEYPYNISTTISNIANTHSQWYQLNMEDPEVTVWYTLEYNGDPAYDSGSVAVYSSLPQDASNNYYIYSKGNVFYSGVGHSSTDASLEERKLFVNTMIAAYRPGAEPPAIEITNPERIWDAAESCYKIRVPKELENGGTYSVETIGNNDVRVRFKPVDFSLAKHIKVKIEYGGTVVGEIWSLNTGASLTKSDSDDCIPDLKNGEEYYFDFPKSKMNPSATINFTIWNEKVTTPGTTVLKIVPQPLFMLD